MVVFLVVSRKSRPSLPAGVSGQPAGTSRRGMGFLAKGMPANVLRGIARTIFACSAQ